MRLASLNIFGMRRAPASDRVVPAPSGGAVSRSMLQAALGAACVHGSPAAAAQLSTLYTFQGGSDGGNPFTETLVPGPNGSLYGSTRDGASGAAAVFQLSPPANGSAPWTYTLLQSFTGDQGGDRPTGLLAGPNGSLYGEDIHGGNPCSCGLVFQLSPPSQGQSTWSETILYTFTNGPDGSFPRDGLVSDSQGNLFGTTVGSGLCADGCGTVFELSPPAIGQTAWPLTTLYSFNHDKGGRYPAGKLLPDGGGGFFGITWGGGNDGPVCYSEYLGCGTIYHLVPPRNGTSAWKKTALYEFTGHLDGQTPYTELTLDESGNVLGMAMNGGLRPHCPTFGHTVPGGCGTVFKLTPPGGGQGVWTLSLPWRFTGNSDGNQPLAAGLVPSGGGYVTTTAGNASRDFGSIDLFTPGVSGRPWTERTLFQFTNDTNGAGPKSYLLERDGVFYGTTYGNLGPKPYGTVFSFKP